MTPNFNLLYVSSAKASGEFYSKLFDLKPVENSDNFVLFVLPGGLKFGLWNRDEVTPKANVAGGFELGIPVEKSETVDLLAEEWKLRGISIIQEPENMDFGRTFTALDPDGHRLRVFHPAN